MFLEWIFSSIGINRETYVGFSIPVFHQMWFM